MNELQVFNFEDKQVRTVLVNDEPHFVGKDAAEILGYERADNAIRNHVDDEDKLTHRISASGQYRNMTIINESGLYSLIFGSKLPSAKKFKRWVTTDVLPQIRKHGMYATEELLDNPDLLIQVATQLKEERTQRLVAEQQVKELQPKANYYDTILANPSLTTISVIAKNYGMSATKMNELLHKLGVQYKQGKTWLLYSKYQNEGYTHTEMKLWEGSSQMKPNTKWTQKGHLFLYDFLKKHDIYPKIETLFESE